VGALLILLAPFQAASAEEIIQRHAENRQAILHLHVVIRAYFRQDENPAFIRRIAYSPARARVHSIIYDRTLLNPPRSDSSANGSNSRGDSSVNELNKEIRDVYYDGKHRFDLLVGNRDSVPEEAPEDFTSQYKQLLLRAQRKEAGGEARNEVKKQLDVMALRTVSSFLAAQGPLYLEELCRRHPPSMVTFDKGNWKLEFDITTKGHPQISRETVVVFLSPQHDFTITKLHHQAWSETGKQIWNAEISVASFQQRSGIWFPREVVYKAWDTQKQHFFRYLFSDLFINERLPRTAFDFSIPENGFVFHVDDQWQPTQVLQYGKQNQVTRSMSIEEFRRIIQQQEGVTPPRAPKNQTLWPLVATLGLLALALGLALLWRRTGRTAPPGESS